MREFKYFRTYSYAGMEGTDLEKRDFETIELAKNDALNDQLNSNFNLYEITMILDGKITETTKYLGQITCGKDLQNFESKENSKKI